MVTKKDCTVNSRAFQSKFCPLTNIAKYSLMTRKNFLLRQSSMLRALEQTTMSHKHSILEEKFSKFVFSINFKKGQRKVKADSSCLTKWKTSSSFSAFLESNSKRVCRAKELWVVLIWGQNTPSGRRVHLRPLGRERRIRRQVLKEINHDPCADQKITFPNLHHS